MFFQYPAWTGVIRNHYWHLRYVRGFHEARRRREYRIIEAEKNAFYLRALILRLSDYHVGIWLICRIRELRRAGGIVF